MRDPSRSCWWPSTQPERRGCAALLGLALRLLSLLVLALLVRAAFSESPAELVVKAFGGAR